VERRQLERSREPLLGGEIAVPAGNSAGEMRGISRRRELLNGREKSAAHPKIAPDGPIVFVAQASACVFSRVNNNQ